MVTVAHGGDTEQADLAGRSVQEVREAYRHVFSIPDDAIVMVNGKEHLASGSTNRQPSL